MTSEDTNMPPFGRELREKEFCLRKDATFLNHGSYGTVPRRVKEAHKRHLDLMEDHPDDWFRRNNLRKWKSARDAVAAFVNADPGDVVFVQNATAGVNTILKSIDLKEGDGVLATNNTYPAMQFTCEHVTTAANGSEYHLLDIRYPIESEDDLVEQYRKYISSHPSIRVAVVDHITSPTALLQPIKKIIQVCRQHGVLSLIDGAHAPGQAHIDMKDLDPDFYTGNLHKWAYAPRGCALLYIKKEHQSWVRPLVTSWYHRTGLTMEFFMQGTRDDSSYVLVPDALRFYKDLGGREVITGYTSSVLDHVTKQMATEWGTDKLPVPTSMEAPCMRMVRLPHLDGYEASLEESIRLMDDLYYQHDIQVQLFSFLGSLYVRVSANVYNCTGDYRPLIELIRDVSQNKQTLCLKGKVVENTDRLFSGK